MPSGGLGLEATRARVALAVLLPRPPSWRQKAATFKKRARLPPLTRAMPSGVLVHHQCITRLAILGSCHVFCGVEHVWGCMHVRLPRVVWSPELRAWPRRAHAGRTLPVPSPTRVCPPWPALVLARLGVLFGVSRTHLFAMLLGCRAAFNPLAFVRRTRHRTIARPRGPRDAAYIPRMLPALPARGQVALERVTPATCPRLLEAACEHHALIRPGAPPAATISQPASVRALPCHSPPAVPVPAPGLHYIKGICDDLQMRLFLFCSFLFCAVWQCWPQLRGHTYRIDHGTCASALGRSGRAQVGHLRLRQRGPKQGDLPGQQSLRQKASAGSTRG